MDALILAAEDAFAPDVQALLARHFELMRGQSPAESCHVMEPSELADADAHLMGVRRDGVLLGVGAIKAIGPAHGELKSMHTAKTARGQGVAGTLLRGLQQHATASGMKQMSLETGTDDIFLPARALYAAHGFTECAPFATYVADPLSVFMTKFI